MCVAFFLHYYMCCKPTDRIKVVQPIAINVKEE